MRSGHSNGSRAVCARGIAALCAALIMAAAGGSAFAAPKETVLYSFQRGSDGAFPEAGLIADSSGNLYGTTSEGGDGTDFGTVFKLSPGGTETVLHAFKDSDGANPRAGLIADGSGNLYGTTLQGGGSGCSGLGCGAVFKLTRDGTVTVLHRFEGSVDGSSPSGLVADSSGNLYGTTEKGGGSGCGTIVILGCGTVFKVSPNGTKTVLYAFKGGSDGAVPSSGLIIDSSGNLYGATSEGGGSGCFFGRGCGVVFKVTPGGTETVLFKFKRGDVNSIDLIDSNGNLYGRTRDFGTVFKLSPGGTYTVLYAFKGGSDGGAPNAGLIADSSGDLYGTAFGGGLSNSGVVFKLSPGGTETVLYSFRGGTDGAGPRAGLLADSSGNLYGTTENGGGSGCGGPGCGTVFKLSGTGFVPPPPGVPFLAFNAKLAIQFGSIPTKDAFAFGSNFLLSSTAPAIDPLTDPVTLQIGTFATTIPAGSFKKQPNGSFTFQGKIHGVGIGALIKQTGTLRYLFEAQARGADLTGTANPVPVTLIIGGDSGATSLTAEISH
ncbi:MAG: choice-of-anchor tandem repeat GloVer-containing protein [Beijerinckiaceae bacterium]